MPDQGRLLVETWPDWREAVNNVGIMLAQLQGVPAEFSHNALLLTVAVIGALSGVTGIVVGVVSLMRGRKRQIEPQPLLVSLQERFALKEDVKGLVTVDKCKILNSDTSRRLEWLEKEILAIRQEMKINRDQIGALVLQEVGKVHERINHIADATSEQKGMFKQMAAALAVIQQQIQHLQETKG